MYQNIKERYHQEVFMERTKTEFFKKIILCLLLVTTFFSSLLLSGCLRKVSSFSEERHAERIRSRLLERWKGNLVISGVPIEDFELYPLYDENDKLAYFLVECEPNGFFFVLLRDETFVYAFSGGNMYTISNNYYGYGDAFIWSPYTVDLSKPDPFAEENKIFELDESGEKICYSKSPFFITDNLNERKYLLNNSRYGYVCAVKNQNNFTNVMNGETFWVQNRDNEASLYIQFIGKPPFFL